MSRACALVAVAFAPIGLPCATAAQQPATECPTSTVLTDGWQTTAGFSVGVAVQHPTRYVRKIWEVVSDSTSRYLLLRKDDGIMSSVEVLSGRRSTSLWRDRPESGDRECTMPTGSGPMPARIGRRLYSAYIRGAVRRDSSFNIAVRLNPPGEAPPLVFYSFARDSADFFEHLAIARTLKLLSAGRERP